MQDLNNTPMQENQEEESFNIYEIIFKYLVYWPWFVASVIVCLAVAFLYMRYQTPVYNVSSAVLIKEMDPRQKAMSAANGALGALQDMGGFSMTSSFDNEVEILKSRTLISKVVTELGLYINTSEKRFLGYNVPLYRTSPVNVYLTPEEAERLYGGVKLDMKYTVEGKLSVKAKYFTEDEEEHEAECEFDSIPAVFPTPVGVFSFSKNDSVPALEEDMKMVTYISSPTAAAIAYAKNMSVSPTSKTTTIAAISVKNTSKRRAVDFINSLVRNYNQDANDEKNEVARKSAEFIEERLAIINSELGSTESELAAFKQRSGLTDLTTDAQIALEESTKYEQQRIDAAGEGQYPWTYAKHYERAAEVLDGLNGLCCPDTALMGIVDDACGGEHEHGY